MLRERSDRVFWLGIALGFAAIAVMLGVLINILLG